MAKKKIHLNNVAKTSQKASFSAGNKTENQKMQKTAKKNT